LIFVGRLLGHLSTLSTGCLMKEKGLLLTVDERSLIKIWKI